MPRGRCPKVAKCGRGRFRCQLVPLQTAPRSISESSVRKRCQDQDGRSQSPATSRSFSGIGQHRLALVLRQRLESECEFFIRDLITFRDLLFRAVKTTSRDTAEFAHRLAALGEFRRITTEYEQRSGLGTATRARVFQNSK
jgi:hypothetical protein